MSENELRAEFVSCAAKAELYAARLAFAAPRSRPRLADRAFRALVAKDYVARVAAFRGIVLA